jgi:H+/Cl- antiporter ClcA
VLAGLAGSYMCKLILRLMRFRAALKSTFRIALFVGISALLVAAIAVFLDRHILGSGRELMTDILFGEDKYVSWHTVIFRVAGPVISFCAGGAGGVFAPSLAAGASIGSLVADFFDLAGSNANILILSGMVGFLVGVTRAPFTSAILVLEMTDRHNVIFILMIAALLANIVSLLIDKHSFYDQLKQGYIREVSETPVPEHPSGRHEQP